ncbi:MAG: V-type ATP synthase subunit F [Acidilobus sp.]|jgi:V/A-type H+-transporting ATPase subunit F
MQQGKGLMPEVESGETGVVVIGDRLTLPLFRMTGMKTIEASDQRSAEEALRQAASDGYRIAIVLKHIVSDEDSIRKVAARLNITLLVLPTKWSKPTPFNVEKLLAEALGLG